MSGAEASRASCESRNAGTGARPRPSTVPRPLGTIVPTAGVRAVEARGNPCDILSPRFGRLPRPPVVTRTEGTMPELLTESFCERCGTRYTFESVAPKKTRKLGQFKTLGKGVKNWVMSDDSSLDEAMAIARSDEEREVTSQQLEAFHSTFNFCMSCRQYTCANCWNTADGQCLSCAPLGEDAFVPQSLEAPAPEVTPLVPEAWPQVDLAKAVTAEAAVEAWPGADTAGNGAHAGTNGFATEEVEEFDAAARLAFLAGDVPAPAVEAEAPAEVDAAVAEPAEAAPETAVEEVAAQATDVIDAAGPPVEA